MRALSLWRVVITAPPAKVTMGTICAEVAERHGLTVRQLRCRSRRIRYSHPRQEAMWEIRQRLGFSLPRIGQFFGRDHTTVLHACRAHERRRLEPDVQ